MVKFDSIDLIDNFILELKKKKNVVWCDDLSTFFEKLTQFSLFNLNDNQNNAIVLNRLYEDYLKDIRNTLEGNEFNDVVVLIERKEDKLSGKDYEVLKKICRVIEFKEPEEKVYIKYVNSFFNEKNLRYEGNLPAYIVFMVGKNFLRLNNELNKILDYFKSGFNGVIDKEIIDAICVLDEEIENYKLVELFFKKRIKDFFDNFNIKEYSFQYGFIQYLLKVVERLYKIYMLKGRDPSLGFKEISTCIGVPIFLLEKLMTYLLYFNGEKILLLLELLNDLEVQLRSIDMRKDLLIESYLLKAFAL